MYTGTAPQLKPSPHESANSSQHFTSYPLRNYRTVVHINITRREMSRQCPSWMFQQADYLVPRYLPPSQTVERIMSRPSSLTSLGAKTSCNHTYPQPTTTSAPNRTEQPRVNVNIFPLRLSTQGRRGYTLSTDRVIHPPTSPTPARHLSTNSHQAQPRQAEPTTKRTVTCCDYCSTSPLRQPTHNEYSPTSHHRHRKHTTA